MVLGNPAQGNDHNDYYDENGEDDDDDDGDMKSEDKNDTGLCSAKSTNQNISTRRKEKLCTGLYSPKSQDCIPHCKQKDLRPS